jgi:hypothetical protein
MKLHPIRNCQETAIPFIEKGATIHQQFLCAHCGAKNTMEKANTWYASGACEECNKITNIERDGCNYLLRLSFSPNRPGESK